MIVVLSLSKDEAPYFPLRAAGEGAEKRGTR